MTTICATFFSPISFVLILSSASCSYIATCLFRPLNDLFDARYTPLTLSFVAFLFTRFFLRKFVLLMIFFVLLHVIAFCPLGVVTGMYFLIILNPRKIKVLSLNHFQHQTDKLLHTQQLVHFVGHRNVSWDIGSILYHLKIHFDSV